MSIPRDALTTRRVASIGAHRFCLARKPFLARGTIYCIQKKQKKNSSSRWAVRGFKHLTNTTCRVCPSHSFTSNRYFHHTSTPSTTIVRADVSQRETSSLRGHKPRERDNTLHTQQGDLGHANANRSEQAQQPCASQHTRPFIGRNTKEEEIRNARTSNVILTMDHRYGIIVSYSPKFSLQGLSHSHGRDSVPHGQQHAWRFVWRGVLTIPSYRGFIRIETL